MSALTAPFLEYLKVSPGLTGSWIMHQQWHDLLFAHWSVPAEVLRPLIPADLTLDTYNGEAWLGLIAFHLSGIRLRGLPAVPFTCSFAELNVRTYVIRDGKPGIYFLSLDASNPLAAAIARAWYRLGYTKARMSIERENNQINFISERTQRGAYPAQFAASYQPVSECYYAIPGTLEYWLTERYRFYTLDNRQRLYSCDVQHAPWPLHKAEAQISFNNMALTHKIDLSSFPPLLHYVPTINAVIWSLKGINNSESMRFL